tara:strand:- start:601 stop:867 length:267 start_codon:yes stop_codon:yes gene_type:complete
MLPYTNKILKKKIKPIKIKIDINNVKNKIMILRDEIFKKQQELLEFMEFFQITNEKNSDIKQINKEINILNDKLEKLLIIYKDYKNVY